MSTNFASSPCDLSRVSVRNKTSMSSSQRKWFKAACLTLVLTDWVLKRHTLSMVEVVVVVSAIGSNVLVSGVAWL